MARSIGLERKPSGITDHATLTRNESRGEGPRASVSRVSVVHCPDHHLVGTTLELSRDAQPIVIGRKPDAARRIVDPQLSRIHARVVWDPAAYQFRIGDAHSKNGTFLNGVRTDSALLSDGDVLRAGDTLLVFDNGDPMQEVRQAMPRAGKSELSVLILGETGSGKELLARSLHETSGCKGDFVALNCGGMPRELVAAELFGHVKGAFSGASGDRPGLFTSADGGTLFLDEIGDLPLEAQPALLRALQERRLRRVGSDTELQTTARVVAATHADLLSACQQGTFRNDLYARLAQIVVEVPPLRKRRAELLELARGFARKPLELTPDAAEILLTWHFPNNVRELKTLIEAFETMSDEALLTSLALKKINARLTGARPSTPKPPEPTQGGAPDGDALKLKELLAAHRGNVASVARVLGRSRSHVYRSMQELGLATGSGRRRV